MEETTKLLLQLVCSVLIHEPAKDLPELDSETLAAVYKLAQKHELAHLAGEGLRLAGVMPGGELGAKFRKQKMAAIYSDQTKCIALDQVDAALTAAQIPFIPLKGSVLRDYYPEPWMRSRCDIDVLVRREDLEAACTAMEAIGYQIEDKACYDVIMNSPGGVHFELHHSFFREDETVKQSFLEDIWKTVEPQSKDSFCCVMDDAMFYAYHVFHMAKHMRRNGCGLRPFLDLWILDHLANADLAGRGAQLKKLGLDTFAQTAGLLADSWFDENTAVTTLAKQLEDFIISSGIFGNEEISISNWRGSSWDKLMERVFIPYKTLVVMHPSLKKYPWLTPVFHLARWWDVIRRNAIVSGLRRWNTQRKVYENRDKGEECMMEDLGLNQWKSY